MEQTTEFTTDKPKESPVKAQSHNTGLAIDAPSLASSSSDTIPEDQHKTSFISKGESAHKWGTYLGVDWLFNTATGVSFAYWGKYTDLGKKIWSEPLTKGFESALKPLIKHPEQLKASAGYGTMFMSIIAGGMFTIPPLMLLEDNNNKRKITECIDKIVYGKKAVNEDPKFKTAYEEIEHAPKKDFTSGMLSRYASLAPELAIILIPTTKKFTNKVYFSHIEHASEVVATKMGLTAKKIFPKLASAEGGSRMKFIHETLAMDLGLGLPYAILHSILYNKFSVMKEKKTKAEEVAGNNTQLLTQAHEEPLASQLTKEPQTQKQWASHVAEKPRPLNISKAIGNFSERIAQTPEREHQLT